MHCLIVDDDPLICDLLQHFCSKVEVIDDVTTANNGFEAINLINQHHYDCVLLDFHLPDITGREILEVIGPYTPVIMITSNKDFGSESYEYDQVIDYIVKPIEFGRFAKAFQKVLKSRSTETKTERLFIKDGNVLVKINLEEVMYIKSAANYVELVQKQKKNMSLMKLKDIEHKLPDYFQRVHRSYIVNINKIDSISKGDILIGSEEIPVSDSYEKALLDKINLLQ